MTTELGPPGAPDEAIVAPRPSGRLGRARRTAAPLPPPLVTWRAGVHLPGTRLWCDALRAHDLCFVSDAQANLRGGRRGAIGTLLCTERTLRLRRALGEPARAAESVLLSPVGRPFHLGSLRLELFPSGQAPGAASLWIKLPSGQCVVYAGAPCPQAALGAEPMQVRAATVLICAAPLALHPHPLPERAAALLTLQQQVAAAAGAATVILCSPLSSAPAIWSQLHAAVPLVAHPAITRALLAYQELGLLAPPAPRRFTRPLTPGTVLLWPAAIPLPARLQPPSAPLQVILSSGAALCEPAVARVRAALPAGATLAAAVPLADGLDQPSLLRYIADSEARQVYLTAGYSDALAATLRRTGVHLAPLGPPRQLPLFSEPPPKP